jgi:DNA-binding transcriptional MerR regulator
MIQLLQKTAKLFSVEELNELEQLHPQGISSVEVISLFQARGIKLSEATFRKYVQLGLLPTSRRVGRKGKHLGSKGVYPISVMRRINLIKRMMIEGLTLEDIRNSFLSVQNELEQVSEALERLFRSIDKRLERLKVTGKPSPLLLREFNSTRKGARVLMDMFERIGSRIAVAGSVSISKDEGGLS